MNTLFNRGTKLTSVQSGLLRFLVARGGIDQGLGCLIQSFAFINRFPHNQESQGDNMNTKRSLLFTMGAGIVSSAFAQSTSSTI